MKKIPTATLILFNTAASAASPGTVATTRVRQTEAGPSRGPRKSYPQDCHY
jgi:hypothetical protein